jgi:hypothetical protein
MFVLYEHKIWKTFFLVFDLLEPKQKIPFFFISFSVDQTCHVYAMILVCTGLVAQKSDDNYFFNNINVVLFLVFFLIAI